MCYPLLHTLRLWREQDKGSAFRELTELEYQKKKKIQIKLFWEADSTVKEMEQGNGIRAFQGWWWLSLDEGRRGPLGR